MKLDKLFEKFLSLFKKETSELEDSDSTSLRRSRSDRKKLAQVGPIRKFWRRYHLTKIVLILGLSAGLLVGTYLFAVAKSTNVNDLQKRLENSDSHFLTVKKRRLVPCLVKKELMLN